MSWKITKKDSKKLLLFKLSYLIPLFTIAYLPLIIYLGLKNIESPCDLYREVKQVWRNAK